jgi:hypothetical protein
MKALIGAGLIAVLTVAAPAFGNDGQRDAGINERQFRLTQRIEQGFRSGELTRNEYSRLRHEASDIERAEHFFRSDGYLSPRERSDLHARLDHLSRAVHHERHDFERGRRPYNYDYPVYRRF